jgi:hypothetical protein
MAANSTLSLVSLDPDTLSANFISFMKQQSQFKDYDFEGSNLRVLIDLLSYNTFLNSFYLNMIASEAFLDTSQLATSAYSHAKELNYTPRSAISSQAKLNLTFTTDSTFGTTLIVPKSTGFTTKVGSNSYNFYTDTTQVFHSSNNYWSFNVDVYEGNYVTDTFVMDYNNETQRFILSNEQADISSCTVTSLEDNGATTVQYFKKTTLLDLNSTSKAYFIQGAETGFFEVVFGDDIIGRRPKDGSIIAINYRTSGGSDPNGATTFSLNTDLTGGKTIGTPKIVTLTPAYNGSFKESVASVKFNAPRYFQTQERAVSSTDYQTIMQTQFPEINNIAVYGGETVNPPRYGKVFVSVDISGVEGLPESKQVLYYNFLKPRMPLTQEPIFVTPSKIYYSVSSVVKYNVNKTNYSPADVSALIKNAIVSYNNTYLNKFNSILRYSQLTRVIDSTDASIVGNETEVFAYKKLYPKIGTAQNITVNFNMPLLNTLAPIPKTHPLSDLHTIYSSEFFYQGISCYLEDDADGNLRIVKQNGNNHETVLVIGTVDYNTGVLSIQNFTIDSYSGTELKIYALSAEKDIVAGQNDILNLEASEINLTVQAIRE